ncbi:hypothetical protein CSUI_007517, partial [Cystoisospora suis]
LLPLPGREERIKMSLHLLTPSFLIKISSLPSKRKRLQSLTDRSLRELDRNLFCSLWNRTISIFFLIHV